MAADGLSVDEQLELVRYEDLRSCANRTVWTISLQIRRLQESIDCGFVLRPVSDAEWPILSFERLLVVARQIDLMTGGSQRAAIAVYEGCLPNLRQARNVIAHLDEYLRGIGRNKAIPMGSLSTTIVGPGRLSFAGFEFDLLAAQHAAEQLFTSIRESPPESFRKAVAKWGTAQ